MPVFRSKGFLKNDIVVWEIEAHQFEFTRSEFLDLTLALRKSRLFACLDQERPALRNQLTDIRENLAPDVEMPDFEFMLEQALLDLKLKLF